VALGTPRGLGARARPRAAALLAGRCARHLEGARATEARLLDRDVERHAQVAAVLGARPAPAAPLLPAEEHVEEVERGVEGDPEVANALGRVPEAVIALTPPRVAEHRVGLADLLEALLCPLVAVVAIGV